MTNFENNYKQMLDAIKLCIELNLQLPALTLIYSMIDIFAYRCYGNIEVQARFIKWIKEYMYKEKNLNIEPIDLYSARCAILHTLTPNSKLIKDNKANVIVYAWGDADLKTLEEGNKNIDNNLKAIHINDLYESLRLGILRFEKSDMKFARKDEDYAYLSQEALETYNQIILE